MKITIEEIPHDDEEEIILRVRELTPEITELVSRIKSAHTGLTGFSGESAHRLSFDDIFYFEAVDGKTFFYTEDSVYESKLRLYEFEEMSCGKDFFRASKSMILNFDKIDFIKPSLSGRFEAVLLNGEKVVISRQYVNTLKKKMGL